MNKEDTIKYESNKPIPPGDTIIEILQERGMTQKELSKRLDRPLKTINAIVKGKSAITSETALQLEQTLGIEASFWNNLESKFQEQKLRIESEKQYRELITTSKIYPYSEMVNNDWLEKTTNPIKKVQNLLSFFGVTNFDNIIEETKLEGAFRISEKHKYSMPAIVSWLRKGSIDGERISTEPFDHKKVKELVPKLREMTLVNEPNELMHKLRDEFKKCGVAFVVTKSLKNAPICGATRWIGQDKALVQMSLRWSWVDIFWFSLFHELGHIIKDNKKEFNVDFVKNKVGNQNEKEKDEFARDSLIPPEQYQELEKNITNVSSIGNINVIVKSFAKNIGIHPGIVIGRLQHEKKISPNINSLRIRYSWN